MKEFLKRLKERAQIKVFGIQLWILLILAWYTIKGIAVLLLGYLYLTN